MLNEPHNLAGSGLLLHTGLNPRARDPREDKYRLAAIPDLDWRSVDLNAVHSIRTATVDPVPPVTWQGGKGACASFSTTEAAQEQQVLTRRYVTQLSGSDLYERVRKAENGANWTQDTGSTLAGNADIAMTGLYSLADAPDSDDLTRNYDAQTAGKQVYDDILGHAPGYPNEDTSDPDYVIKLICAALDAKRSVVLGSYWPDAWFYPDASGMLPKVAQVIVNSAHAYKALSWLPILGGCFLCANHWNQPGGNPWNPQVAGIGYSARPGDFLVPAWAFRGNQPAVFEVRALTPEPVQPQPQPDPQPQPTTCRQASLQLAAPIVEKYKALFEQNPRSTIARYGLRGAQEVVNALGEMPE